MGVGVSGMACESAPCMKPPDLVQRTYAFGIAVVEFCRSLPETPEARRIRGQLADSGTAVAANYRGACRARSRAEFISKIAVCCEEADESHMWLLMCVDLGFVGKQMAARLVDEAEQLRRIFTAAQLTAKRRDRGRAPTKHPV